MAHSNAAHEAVNQWVAFFAKACRRAAEDALAFEARVAELKAEWRRRLGRIRSGSAAERLIERLPGAPIITAKSAATLIERSFQSTNSAIGRLEEAGVLAQFTLGRRNRAFEAPEVIDVFAMLERQLAVPAGDTRVSPPARRVPHRR